MPKVLFALVVLILGIHFPALTYDWYGKIPWLDVPMHIAGGFWLGLLFYYLFVIGKPVLNQNNTVALFILGLGFVAFVGVLWELYEFLADVYLLKAYALTAASGYTHFDTFTDVVNDFIGGAIALVISPMLFTRAPKDGER